MNFFFETFCERVKCPTSQHGKIYCIQPSNINACRLQSSKLCATRLFSLPYGHTYIFCSYNEKQKYSPIIFSFRKHEHGYLACDNSCLSSLFPARDVWQNVPSGEKRRLLSQANGYFTYLGIQLCQFVWWDVYRTFYQVRNVNNLLFYIFNLQTVIFIISSFTVLVKQAFIQLTVAGVPVYCR